jgi:hypothetical protein
MKNVFFVLLFVLMMFTIGSIFFFVKNTYFISTLKYSFISSSQNTLNYL